MPGKRIAKKATIRSLPNWLNLGRLIIIAAAVVAFAGLRPALAASPDALSVLLSDTRTSVESRQTITLDQSAGTAFSSGETITITFPASFTVPAFAPSDVSFDDGTSRNILASCSAGANNIELDVSGQTVTFTACSGYSASANGSIITIILGTASTKITNPSVSSVYVVEVAGSYGDDPQGAAVAITTGTTFSLTIPSPAGSVRFTGDAFPGALITILDGGAVIGNAVANSTSFFDKTVSGLSAGIHTFGIFGQALDGRKTITLSFNINVVGGTTTTVGGILLPPIITVPTSAKRPATLPQTGLARHNSTVTTFTNSHNAISRQTTTDANGQWSVSVTDVLHLGAHTASALVNDGSGNQSILSGVQNFEITLSADLNIDNLVNLVDFSILMFNYGLANPPNLAADINDSGSQVDLVDFSVMMFYWTGG